MPTRLRPSPKRIPWAQILDLKLSLAVHTRLVYLVKQGFPPRNGVLPTGLAVLQLMLTQAAEAEHGEPVSKISGTAKQNPQQTDLHVRCIQMLSHGFRYT